MLVFGKSQRISIHAISRYSFLKISNHHFSTTSPPDILTFEDIGVDSHVARGLRKGFPHVQTPTPTQEEFIPAILEGNDILLQDRTGTGKSFGLLLALLSKPRASRRIMPKYWKDRATQTVTLKEAITSIIIVPHNDLARQFRQWVKTMGLTRDLNTLVQTLLKDSEENFEEQVLRITKETPHILITTPKALEACWSNSHHLLTLDSVSTIVLEEADALLKIPSNNTPISLQRKWRKHPPITQDLLDSIFKTRPKKLAQSLNEMKPVQLILASATLRPAVRKFLFLETKWLSQESNGTVTIEGTHKTDRREDPVRHYGLFVDIVGNIRNIINSEEAPIAETRTTNEVAKEDEGEDEPDDPNDVPGGPKASISAETLSWKGNRLPSQLLDAVVSTFVLDVPAYALLIIPSNVSALRTVEELTSLGVRAVNLDDYIQKPGETMHRLKKNRPTNSDNHGGPEQHTEERDSQTLIDDPIMLVAVQAAVRGIDLPIISHVFIAGVPESDVDYVHLSGRVGRMGAISTSGHNVKKVITFLPEPILNPHLARSKALKLAMKSKKDLEKMWNMVGITPSVYARAV